MYQKIEKTISNFYFKWTLQFIQRGVPDFLLRRCWYGGIHKWRHHFLKEKGSGICKNLWRILSKFGRGRGQKTDDFIYGWPLRGVTFTHNNTEAIGRGQIRKMHILWQKLIHLTFVKITSLRLQMSISIRINENFASYFYCDNIMGVAWVIEWPHSNSWA